MEKGDKIKINGMKATGADYNGIFTVFEIEDYTIRLSNAKDGRLTHSLRTYSPYKLFAIRSGKARRIAIDCTFERI